LQQILHIIGQEQMSNIRLVYSDAMSTVKIDSADFLFSLDAWHPRPLGIVN